MLHVSIAVLMVLYVGRKQIMKLICLMKNQGVIDD